MATRKQPAAKKAGGRPASASRPAPTVEPVTVKVGFHHKGTHYQPGDEFTPATDDLRARLIAQGLVSDG